MGSTSSLALPKWLRPAFYVLLIVLILILVWEGYKLLAAPGGKFLTGTGVKGTGLSEATAKRAGSIANFSSFSA